MRVCIEHFDSGAIIAAPSSSLPEAIGGPRNWDYRYSWVRDAAFMVYALHRIGFSPEAAGFLAWVLDAFERGGSPKVLYTIDGTAPAPEREDPELEGYRGSRPVRWGNGAAEQIQHDVYGEILDCAYQFAAPSRSDRCAAVGASQRAGHIGGQRMAHARSRHLGSTDFRAPFHLFGRNVRGGARSGGAYGCTLRS